METVTLIVVVVAVMIIAFAAWIAWRQLTTKRLREQFGPEYDRTVTRLKNREVAERELRERQQRVTQFKIMPLPANDCQHYRARWEAVQAQFVDHPQGAVNEAHALIQEVMRKRGYPMGDFEQSAADLSVEHPAVVENYRAAHAIAERNKRGDADTEALRQAFVYYRALFDELLESRAKPETERRESVGQRIRKINFGRASKKGGIRA